MEVSLLIGFVFASFVLALMPGPDNLYVLTESMVNGARQGVLITIGLVSGVIVHTTLVATGLSVLVFKHDAAYNLVKYAGAVYLLYLAWGALREIPPSIDQSGVTAFHKPVGKLLKKGFLMNVLNPKVSIFFIAFLPQFVTSNGWPPMLQLMVLGLLFMVVSFLVFSSLALTSGFAVSFISNPGFLVITKWVKVIVLLSLALYLAGSER